MKAKTDKSDEFERERLSLERARVELEHARCMNDRTRAATERLDKLVEIVKYFNDQQEEQRTTIETTYEKISMCRFARNLNGHEEDIYNAALISIKRMIGFQETSLVAAVGEGSKSPRDRTR